MSAPPALLAGLGVAFPPGRRQAELWEGYFAAHFAGIPGAERAFFATGVDARHTVVDPLTEDCSSWSTGKRMACYVERALPLAEASARAALDAAALPAGEVGLLVVCSCTGYATPGVDVRLASALDLDPRAERLLVGHLGCHAALPALHLAADRVRVEGRPALVCTVELSSLHLQPPGGDLSQVIIHGLFGDGASAAVLTAAPADGGLVLRGVTSLADPADADLMTWEVTDQGFRMHLDRAVPAAVGRSLAPLVEELCGRHGCTPRQVEHWAVHPGGPAILRTVAGTLGLSADALVPSEAVLAAHGNCSSATLFAVVDAVLARSDLQPGDRLVALGFGPGLSAYAALFEQVGPSARGPEHGERRGSRESSGQVSAPMSPGDSDSRSVL